MLRPSLLPKLAECSCYQPAPGQSGAAARGTLMDSAFRAVMQGQDMIGDLAKEDTEAVLWAVDTLKAIAGSDKVLTLEEDCKVDIECLKMQGTADAIIPEKRMLADLKSGQIRNYKEQMAAYAIGLMNEHWVDEWTCHLLFCDQQVLISHHFTFPQAFKIADDVVQGYKNSQKAATPCDYCEWCALSTTCEARVSAALEPLGVSNTPETKVTEIFEAILNDPDRLGDFLEKCKILEKFQEKAQEKAKGLLEAGIDVAGWKLGKGRISEFVDARKVYEYRDDLGLGNIFESYGSMSGAKFKKLWEENSDQPLPEGVIAKKEGNKPLIKN